MILEAAPALKPVEAFQISAQVADERKILNGRPLGAKIFETIINKLRSSGDVILPLDFGGVEFLDFSCADEIVCKLLARIRSGELSARVALSNIEGSILENVEAALNEREMCCVLREAAVTRVIGKLSDPLRETWEYARKKQMITTRDVEDHFRIKTSASSNRLASLEKMGLLYFMQEGPTDRGGRQYTYQAIA